MTGLNFTPAAIKQLSDLLPSSGGGDAPGGAVYFVGIDHVVCPIPKGVPQYATIVCVNTGQGYKGEFIPESENKIQSVFVGDVFNTYDGGKTWTKAAYLISPGVDGITTINDGFRIGFVYGTCLMSSVAQQYSEFSFSNSGEGKDPNASAALRCEYYSQPDPLKFRLSFRGKTILDESNGIASDPATKVDSIDYTPASADGKTPEVVTLKAGSNTTQLVTSATAITEDSIEAAVINMMNRMTAIVTQTPPNPGPGESSTLDIAFKVPSGSGKIISVTPQIIQPAGDPAPKT